MTMMEYELQLSIEQREEQSTILIVLVHLLELEKEQRRAGKIRIAEALGLARMAFLSELECIQQQ